MGLNWTAYRWTKWQMSTILWIYAFTFLKWLQIFEEGCFFCINYPSHHNIMEHPGVCINNNTNVLYEKDRRVEYSSLECQAHKNTKNRKFVTLSIPTYLGRLKKILFFLYNNKFSNIIKKCPQLNLKQTLKWTYTCNRVLTLTAIIFFKLTNTSV